ncbi:hypothetical protein FC19_GL001446 [Liquorilactobacillus aquaticus DSM 21051]|uniref:Uncharacterized protein n=1 Tax=Liquorilactobacillus aquaticus DSM 21051 TaxID=1423725 RepID=A0A0R2CVW4_9LACO|nr:hypothetical protein [Liquorilactobacillus aquaticus]KRM95965.1 hypothetical protein FC19_GL001446 [Liquorilactobacillus aquaticus DSM 21051]
MAKAINELLKNWLTVFIFVAGLVLIGIGVFTYNTTLGYVVSGAELCLAAYILDREGGE